MIESIVIVCSIFVFLVFTTIVTGVQIRKTREKERITGIIRSRGKRN